jgi:hypothetical protein
MSVVVLSGKAEGVEHACFVCNTSDWAFGPLFDREGDMSAEEVVDAFLEWLPNDPREYSDSELASRHCDFVGQLRKKEPGDE